MPRPQRVQEAEAARAASHTQAFNANHPVEADEDDIPLETQPLDGAVEPVHTNGTGEAEDWTQPIAKRMGWTPREEWTGDPAKWEDHKSFLARTPDAFEAQAERLRRYAQTAETVAEQARLAGIREAEQRLLSAHRAGDEDGVKKAATEIANSKPHPETQAWLAKNPWFWTDPDAQAVAKGAMLRAQSNGAPVEGQLAAADEVIRRRFPELVGAPIRVEPRQESRAEPTLARAPLVQGGARANGTLRASVEKGWADMPAGDRRTYERSFMRQLVRTGMTEDQAKATLARSYWGVGTQGAPA